MEKRKCYPNKNIERVERVRCQHIMNERKWQHHEVPPTEQYTYQNNISVIIEGNEDEEYPRVHTKAVQPAVPVMLKTHLMCLHPEKAF